MEKSKNGFSLLTIEDRDYTKEEISFCASIYHEIFKNDELLETELVLVYRYIREMVFAGIPKKFWNVEILSNKDEKEFCLRSESCFISAKSNRGKTYKLASVAKFLIWLGKKIYFIRTDFYLKELIAYNSKENQESKIILDRMKNADVILFDDVDKFDRGSNNWILYLFERELSNFIDSGKIIYFSASVMPNDLKDVLGSSLISDLIRKTVTYTLTPDMDLVSGKGSFDLSNTKVLKEFLKEINSEK